MASKAMSKPLLVKRKKNMIPNRNINFPNPIKFGAGRISELPQHCKASGINRPLFVTDKGLASTAMVASILANLKAAELPVVMFSEVRPNPTEENVGEGCKVFRAGNHDGVICFGGGSALDTGKMIALMHAQSISIFDLEDVGDWWTRADASKISPNICIPTTAGTGSEVGRAGVITNTKTHEKKIIFHPSVMPSVAILDPELTIGLPPKLTAATGFDAFAHCLESYCCNNYHPLCDGVALEGMRLIKENLATAVKKGNNIDARGNMLMASAMGATAFQKNMGAIHSLSHPFGGLYDAHHGMLNGIIMPYVLKANRRKIEAKIERVAAYLGIKGGFDGFLKFVLALRKETGIPHALKDIGIDASRLNEVAETARKDPNHAGNPIDFSVKQYKALAKKCVTGDL
jgi:alcohol dehydrogenase